MSNNQPRIIDDRIVDGTQKRESDEITETMSYQRVDGLVVKFSAMNVYGEAVIGGIGVYTQIGLASHGESEYGVTLFGEELKYLRAFLNSPEVSEMLDGSLDEE